MFFRVRLDCPYQPPNFSMAVSTLRGYLKLTTNSLQLVGDDIRMYKARVSMDMMSRNYTLVPNNTAKPEVYLSSRGMYEGILKTGQPETSPPD